MKYLVRLLPALLIATILSAQTQTPQQNHPSILPKAEFHSGETARFTFAGTINIQPDVNPRYANAKDPPVHHRQYRLEGALVATFLGMPAGQMLSGMLHFENLRVRDWVSASDVKELESRLHQMESNSWTISRELTLSGSSEVPRGDPYASDLEAILGVAQLALIPQLGNQPFLPGDRKNISRADWPGAITPDAQRDVAIVYATDIPVEGRPCAEFRVTTELPLQQIPSPPEFAERLAKVGVQPLSRASSDTTATYLYDSGSHSFIFLRLQSRVNVRIEAESGDANAPVRIPITLVTHSVETVFNAERVSEPASTAREANLAAFGKTLELSSTSTSGSEVTAVNGNPSGEVSLGDLARKTRVQNESPGKQSKEITLEGSSAVGVGADPPGFKTFTYPQGGMTVLLPIEFRSVPLDKESGIQRFVARVGAPPVVLFVVMGQGPPPTGEASPSGSMETVLQAFIGSKAKLVSKNDTLMGGRPAKMAEFIREKEANTPSLRGLAGVSAASDGKTIGALICATSEIDYPTAESACHTIVESMRVP